MNNKRIYNFFTISFLFFVCLGCSNLGNGSSSEIEKLGENQEYVFSSNYLDLNNFKKGIAIHPQGYQMAFNGGCTDFIPVEQGDNIVFGYSINEIKNMRFVAAYDSRLEIVPSAGCYDGTSLFTVPSGVSYIRISLFDNTLLSDARINKSTTLLRYEPFKREIGKIGDNELKKQEYNAKYRPYTTIYSEEEKRNAIIKPIGILHKPYCCIISDDGLKEVANYSIPMAIRKGIPMTFGLMKYSEVLEEPYLSILKDAVFNHGFEVAQHGWVRYTNYTEDQLDYLFDIQKEYLSSFGFNVESAICPAHAINDVVQAVAARKLKALRTGYYHRRYDWYANGPESNCCSVDCINISVEPLVDHQAHINYACENNLIYVGFYHENELNKRKKEQIEAIIDYAKEKGMEFCTLSQIAELGSKE